MYFTPVDRYSDEQRGDAFSGRADIMQSARRFTIVIAFCNHTTIAKHDNATQIGMFIMLKACKSLIKSRVDIRRRGRRTQGYSAERDYDSFE